MRRLGLCLIVSVMTSTSMGCALMHEMQPHRLWRWNRGPAPSSDPYFSVSDPLPAAVRNRQQRRSDALPVTNAEMDSPVADRE